MNPGKTSQYGGVMGTLSNWAGGVGNSLTGQLPVQKQWAAQSQSNGMPQPSAAVDQTGSTPSVVPTSQPPLQLGGGVPVVKKAIAVTQPTVNQGPWNQPGNEPKWAVRDETVQPVNQGFTSARATAYNGLDDKYGDTTAKKNPLTGIAKAIEGVTIAVDPSLIPYGSAVQVVNSIGQPVALGGNTSGIYYAHDTGSAVKAKTASKGKKPILDFYSKGNPLDINKLIGDEIYYKIVNPGA